MRQKLKPDLDLESVQGDLVETVCFQYKPGVSVRAIAKGMALSPMKVRKILITGGAYSTDVSTEIGELWKDGKTVAEIAEILNMTKANVNSYLPYERIIYNMDERSAEAERQQRYRDRKRSGAEREEKKSLPKVERVRNQTMVIVIGQKLRKMIPAEVLDDATDPLAREQSLTWGTNISGTFELHEPANPDKSIWCAEVTAAGRGKKKKVGVVLMSANCGFAVMAPLPVFPEISEGKDRDRQQEAVKEYRKALEEAFLGAIRQGMLKFALPEERVLDYTETVARVELVKGRRSAPGIRLEELIAQELPWKSGDDPVQRFNVRGNWTDRKFGNSAFYNRVDEAVLKMLGMSGEESKKWLEDFLAPLREKMTQPG